jgi:uncharacterized membrane protein
VPAAPGLAEALLVILRWLHGLAAIAFLGWSAVLWLDGPAASGSSQQLDGPAASGSSHQLDGAPSSASSQRFKEVTELTLLVFLATGAILTFDRLSHGAGGLYAVILAAKVLLGAVAYQFAFVWRRHGLAVGAPDGRNVLISGAGAVLLAAVLKGVFEGGVRG